MGGNQLKTTVLITTYNRGELLKRSLERFTYLTLPDEILVVDDGSSDNTEEIVNSFGDRLPIKYIYNHNPEWSICSFARNIGVKNAIGDLIITSEPEMLWITDIIPLILEERKKYPKELISASIVYHQQSNFPLHPGMVSNPETALKDSIIEEYQTEPRSYRTDSFVKTVNLQATFIASYEKKWLEEIGGWDEQFTGAWGWDDIEIATRLRINGINQHVCKKLHAIHQWHPHLPSHLQGKASLENEKYFKEKQLDLVEKEILEQKRLKKYKKIDPRLIANKDKPWGVIKTK